MSCALFKNDRFDKQTFIHGDVIKKFDYYALCYLSSGYLPSQIVCHDSCLGEDRKKVRWQNEDNINLKTLSPRVMRCFFLKHNLRKPVIISKDIESELIYPTKVFLKIKNLLDSSTSFVENSSIETQLIKKEFFELV